MIIVFIHLSKLIHISKWGSRWILLSKTFALFLFRISLETYDEINSRKISIAHHVCPSVNSKTTFDVPDIMIQYFIEVTRLY